jgi:hypothetical protein
MGHSAAKQVARLTPMHRAFLLGLSQLGHKVVPLRETQIWSRLKSWSQTDRLSDTPHPVGSLLNTALSGSFAEKPVVCHRTHGDFAPWNIKVRARSLFVYDWEDSLPDGLALTDAFHFLYRQASLIGPWPGATRMMHRMLSEVAPLCRPERAQIPDPMTYLQTWMLNEYLNSPSEHIVEMCEQSFCTGD